MHSENLNRTAWLARVHTEKGEFDEEFSGPSDRAAAEGLVPWLQTHRRILPGTIIEIRRPGEPSRDERMAAANRCNDFCGRLSSASMPH